MNPLAILAMLGAAAFGAVVTGIHHKLGLGPTRRELERECDANGWAYNPDNMAKARTLLAEGK